MTNLVNKMSKEFVIFVAVTCSLTQNLILTYEQDVLVSLSLLQVQYNFSQSCFGNLIIWKCCKKYDTEMEQNGYFLFNSRVQLHIFIDVYCAVTPYRWLLYKARSIVLCAAI